jgi:hypothetical protein
LVWLLVLVCALWLAPATVARDWVRPGDILFTATREAPPAHVIPSDVQPAGAHSDQGAELARSADPQPELPALPEPERFSAVASDGWPQDTGRAAVCDPCAARPHEWQVLPEGLMYHSYLAGEKEPRIGLSVLNDRDRGWLWESALGGRVGILRHGTRGGIDPEGWQIDLEGAALARVAPNDPSAPLHATDYRAGVQWTRRTGRTAYKAGYYHISSHVGDEYLQLNPGFNRINYVRDSLVFGVTRDLTPDTQLYGEIGYAIGADGGAEPLEFQFGAQYNPIDDTGLRGAPFAAVNVHLREEVNFGGGINVMAGWRWRGAESGRLLRIGLQYYNGKSIQYQFLHEDQQLFGYGVWFDF